MTKALKVAAFWIIVIGGVSGYFVYQHSVQKKEERRRVEAIEAEARAMLSFANTAHARLPNWKSIPDDPMTIDVQRVVNGKIAMKASLTDVTMIAGKRIAAFESFQDEVDLNLELEIPDDVNISNLQRDEDTLIAATIDEVDPPKEGLFTAKGTLNSVQPLGK